MLVTNYSELRKNLSQKMDEVLLSHSPMIITRESKQPVVMLSLEDFNGYQETIYLAKSPANKKRLTESLKNITAKKYKKHQLPKTKNDKK
ncbi:MAG: type II toxin-antitoxin system Phd/YefM family antitoxin [Rickettsiales bacterium]|nr:type II toxin-antitoxin system Phd/YefM family antitoxin [Rickettsiales bacterium]